MFVIFFFDFSEEKSFFFAFFLYFFRIRIIAGSSIISFSVSSVVGAPWETDFLVIVVIGLMMLIIWMIWFVRLPHHVMKVNHDLHPEFNQGPADLLSAALTTERWTVSVVVCSVTVTASCRVSSHRQMIFAYVYTPDLEAFLESSNTWCNILITMVLDFIGSGVDTKMRFIVIENTLVNSNETSTKRIETDFIVHVEKGIGKNTQDNKMRVTWCMNLWWWRWRLFSLEPWTHLSWPTVDHQCALCMNDVYRLKTEGYVNKIGLGRLLGGEHASTTQSGVEAPRLLKRSLSRVYHCCCCVLFEFQ